MRTPSLCESYNGSSTLRELRERLLGELLERQLAKNMSSYELSTLVDSAIQSADKLWKVEG